MVQPGESSEGEQPARSFCRWEGPGKPQACPCSRPGDGRLPSTCAPAGGAVGLAPMHSTRRRCGLWLGLPPPALHLHSSRWRCGGCLPCPPPALQQAALWTSAGAASTRGRMESPREAGRAMFPLGKWREHPSWSPSPLAPEKRRGVKIQAHFQVLHF